MHNCKYIDFVLSFYQTTSQQATSALQQANEEIKDLQSSLEFLQQEVRGKQVVYVGFYTVSCIYYICLCITM